MIFGIVVLLAVSANAQLTGEPRNPEANSFYKAAYDLVAGRQYELFDDTRRKRFESEFAPSRQKKFAGFNAALIRINEMLAWLKAGDRLLSPEELREKRWSDDSQRGTAGVELVLADSAALEKTLPPNATSLDRERVLRVNGVHTLQVSQSNGAASKHVNSGDIVVAIGGHPVEGMSLAHARNLLRGKIGDKVVLALRRETKLPPFEAAEWTAWSYFGTVYAMEAVPPENGSARIEVNDTDPSIRQIIVRWWDADTLRKLAPLLEEAEKNHQAILFNISWLPGGGDLESVLQAAQMLLSDGTLVQRHTRLPAGMRVETATMVKSQLVTTYSGVEKKPDKIEPRNARRFSGRCAVLVDNDTRFAGEVFARLLQARGRAPACGAATPSFDLVSRTVFELPGGWALDLTDTAFVLGASAPPGQASTKLELRRDHPDDSPYGVRIDNARAILHRNDSPAPEPQK